jgi:hypothetical protein
MNEVMSIIFLSSILFVRIGFFSGRPDNLDAHDIPALEEDPLAAPREGDVAVLSRVLGDDCSWRIGDALVFEVEWELWVDPEADGTDECNNRSRKELPAPQRGVFYALRDHGGTPAERLRLPTSLAPDCLRYSQKPIQM